MTRQERTVTAPGTSTPTHVSHPFALCWHLQDIFFHFLTLQHRTRLCFQGATNTAGECRVLCLRKNCFSKMIVISTSPDSHLCLSIIYNWNRFQKIFNKVIRDNLQEFESHGVTIGTLGCHSPRKGAITMVSTGCTISPPMALICLRACWSMGNVKDR